MSVGNLATRKMIYRLLDQYKDSPKFKGLIRSIGFRFDDTDDIITHLLFGRFLETAENFELDRIGKFLRTPRPYVVDSSTLFTFKSIGDADDPDKGFSSIGSLDGGRYTSVQGSSSGVLADDDTYRQILRGRANVLSIGPSIPDFYTWVTAAFDIDVTLSIPSTMRLDVAVTSGNITQQDKYTIENEGPVLPGVNVIVTQWSP